MPAKDLRLSDADAILVNASGPVVFRVSHAPARLCVSQAGTLKSWDGTAWDAGTTFTESQTITSPGQFQITLDVAGNVSVQGS
jgi:hypothetical protein